MARKSSRPYASFGWLSIVALHHSLLVGLISVYRKKLPPPLSEAFDWYIDILEVHQDYRRLGIATCLIDMVCERAKKDGVYQLRSWSSEDKIEAIPMWKALGFGLCPAGTSLTGRKSRDILWQRFSKTCQSFQKSKRLPAN